MLTDDCRRFRRILKRPFGLPRCAFWYFLPQPLARILREVSDLQPGGGGIAPWMYRALFSVGDPSRDGNVELEKFDQIFGRARGAHHPIRFVRFIPSRDGGLVMQRPPAMSLRRPRFFPQHVCYDSTSNSNKMSPFDSLPTLCK